MVWQMCVMMGAMARWFGEEGRGCVEIGGARKSRKNSGFSMKIVYDAGQQNGVASWPIRVA